jgi:hypothetical protein
VDIARIMGEWIVRTREGIKFVQVFEVSTFLHLIGQNKGATMVVQIHILT